MGTGSNPHEAGMRPQVIVNLHRFFELIEARFHIGERVS